MGKFRKSRYEKNIEREQKLETERRLLQQDVQHLMPDQLFQVTTKLLWHDDGLSATIDLKYSDQRNVNLKELIKKQKDFFEEKEVKSRGVKALFKKNSKIKTHFNLTVIETEIKNKMIDSNKLRFQIEVAYKTNHSKLISGGNYDFGDDFSKGYSLTISQENRETILMNYIIKNLRSKGWGCFFGELNSHCHLKNDYPTTEEAKNILKETVMQLNKTFSEEGMPISLIK